MQQNDPQRQDEKPAKSREERLKEALKANMARRKAQAKERAVTKQGDEEQG